MWWRKWIYQWRRRRLMLLWSSSCRLSRLKRVERRSGRRCPTPKRISRCTTAGARTAAAPTIRIWRSKRIERWSPTEVLRLLRRGRSTTEDLRWCAKSDCESLRRTPELLWWSSTAELRRRLHRHASTELCRRLHRRSRYIPSDVKRVHGMLLLWWWSVSLCTKLPKLTLRRLSTGT